MDVYRKLEQINTKLNNIEETLLKINSRLIELEKKSQNLNKPVSLIDSTYNYLQNIFNLPPSFSSTILTSLIIFAI